METNISIRRHFSNPRTFETTSLRYWEAKGTVSRPERAGQDVGSYAFIRNGTKAECRKAWRNAQDALIAEGFEAGKTETVSAD